MKKIIYVGNFAFPHGNASGARVLGNGYLLRELGYEVIYVGLDPTINLSLKESEQYHDGFQYYNLPYPKGINGWISYKNKFKEVVSLIEKENIHAIISYGSPSISLFGNLIRKWCKRKNIFYLTDCVDWLSSSSGSLIHRMIKFLDDNYQKRILNSKADGVITISSYLSEYYKNKNCKTVIIPPLVNSERYENFHLEKASTNKIQFIYVGMPFATDGRAVKENTYKDRLDLVIEAFSKVSQFDFSFNIYGLTEVEYLSVVSRHSGILKELSNKIFFNGKIKNTDAIVKIANADFTILFRDVNRMTSAGFPTKFVESISCGTPIITTKTSDLINYVSSGKNGFFVDMENQDLLTNQLIEILSLKKVEINTMKDSCRESKLFSYHNYKEKMRTFMDSL